VIRINDKYVYKWTYNCGPGTNTRAELLGVWATLSLTTRLNIDVLQVFGDSKIVIDWLNSRGKLQVISLVGWKDIIKELIKSFILSVSLTFIGIKIRRHIFFPRRLSRCKRGKYHIING
jgi:ribonuclease HI